MNSRRSPWLTTAEAAEYLGYSVSTICELVRSGKLTAAQHRRKAEYRFRAEWLDEFLDASQVKRSAAAAIKPVVRLRAAASHPAWEKAKRLAASRNRR